jgi:hypothetical protein
VPGVRPGFVTGFHLPEATLSADSRTIFALGAIGPCQAREKTAEVHVETTKRPPSYDRALTTALFSAFKLEFRTHPIADHVPTCRGRRIDSQTKLVRLWRVSQGFSDRKKAQKKLKNFL